MTLLDNIINKIGKKEDQDQTKKLNQELEQQDMLNEQDDNNVFEQNLDHTNTFLGKEENKMNQDSLNNHYDFNYDESLDNKDVKSSTKNFSSGIVNNNQDDHDHEANLKKRKIFDNFDEFDEYSNYIKISIMGVGGSGCNIVNHMTRNFKWDDNITIMAANTDRASLKMIENKAVSRFIIGAKSLGGAGSGGDPVVAKNAILTDEEKIHEALTGTDLLILIAGMGKGTGSGATPEIARIAKQLNVMTVGVITMPSVTAEGEDVYSNACEAQKKLASQIFSYTIVSNDSIFKKHQEKASFFHAYELANSYITEVVKQLINIINVPSTMNIDFSDLRNMLKEAKNFNIDTVELKDQYDKEKLKSLIQDSISNGYNESILKDAKKVLVNMEIDKTISVSIKNDIRQIFADLTNNNEINVIYGVNYSDQKNYLKLTYLVQTQQEAVLDEGFSSNRNQDLEYSSNRNTAFSDQELEEYETQINESEIRVK